MRFDLDDLPSEPAHLQHLIRDMAAAVEHRDREIERLKSIIRKLQRAQFGRRSERLDPGQPALALEEIDSDLAREEEKGPHGEKQTTERSSRRKPLPGHLFAFGGKSARKLKILFWTAMVSACSPSGSIKVVSSGRG